MKKKFLYSPKNLTIFTKSFVLGVFGNILNIFLRTKIARQNYLLKIVK